MVTALDVDDVVVFGAIWGVLRPGTHAAGGGHLKMTDLRGEFLFNPLADDGSEAWHHEAETDQVGQQAGRQQHDAADQYQ